MAHITPESRRFGGLLRQYRTQAGLTGDDLGRLLERIEPKGDATTWANHVRSLETGKIQVPTPVTFNALHKALGFPGWEFLRALGYETDCDGEGLHPKLAHAAKMLSDSQQEAAAMILRTMAKASG